jgi:peroxiredoxin-like protein
MASEPETPAPAGAPGAAAVHSFRVDAVWHGDIAGSGEVRPFSGAHVVPIAAAAKLDGSGDGVNPEELFLSAVAACFIATWALFLKKLHFDHPDPQIRVEGDLGADPAGGFKMQGVRLYAQVPARLLAAREKELRRTVELAEKYCIISKIARAAMPMTVSLETTP